jgi:5-methylcytosine-specific restriction enzyme subunit McrC
MRIPIQNLYYLLCYAWQVPIPRATANMGIVDTHQPLDLLLHLLLGATTALLKNGLAQTYTEQTHTTANICGKLHPLETAILQHQNRPQAHCTFDVLQQNTLPNRVLKTTIGQLLKLPQLPKQALKKLLLLQQRLQHIEPINLTQALFEQLETYRYTNQRYYLVINICRLLYHNLLPNEAGKGYVFHDFRFDEQQMGRLFEAFVRNFYRQTLPNFSVFSEHLYWQTSNTNTATKQLLPRMKTDISLLSSSQKIIIETKFYSQTLQTHYQNQQIAKFQSSNLYQLFTYIKQSAQKQPQITHSGILLYPTVKLSLNEHFVTDGHLIRIVTLNLDQNWQLIHQHLLNMVQ